MQQYRHRRPVELYDLSSDPDELRNGADQPAHAADLARCRAAVEDWMAANHDHGLASDIAARPPAVKVPED